MLEEDGHWPGLNLNMVATAALQVLARYVLGRPKLSVPWTEEGGGLMMVLGSALGALRSASVQTNHISMTAVLCALP